MFITISGGIAGDPAAVSRLVSERAEHERKKLAKASADERHLFVWLDATQPAQNWPSQRCPTPGA